MASDIHGQEGFTRFDSYVDKKHISNKKNENKLIDNFTSLPSETKFKKNEPEIVFGLNERYDGEHSAMMIGIMSQRAMDAQAERSKVRRATQSLEGNGVRVINDSTFPIHSTLGKFGLLPEIAPVVLTQEDLGIKVVGGTRDDFIALGRALEAQIATEKAIEELGSITLMGGEHSV